MTERQVLQVSELNNALRGLIEDGIGNVWVQGEISNLSKPASGHWYFTLKDAQAQMRCAMFKQRNFYIRPAPKDGDKVLVRAQVTLYPARGELQIICEHLEPLGNGNLLQAFELLKKQLHAAGLFNRENQRSLPRFPLHIGVITSSTGAAVEDIRTTLARRWPMATVWLYPVLVQGAEAAPAIVNALARLPSMAPVSVILLGRGGGSLEDLWAFNEEAVVRAIRACSVPVVTGIGHEIDTTLADYAADLRAATPTAAAEQISPDFLQTDAALTSQQNALFSAMHRLLSQSQQRQQLALQRLHAQHPSRKLRDQQQRSDELQMRTQAAMQRRIIDAKLRLESLSTRLQTCTPNVLLQTLQARHLHLRHRLGLATHHRLQNSKNLLAARNAVLSSYNPQAILERGYSILQTEEGRVICSAQTLNSGQLLRARLADGTVQLTVT